MHVDEVMADPAAWQGKRLQLHGYVADLRQRPNSLDYRFQVQINGQVITASYTGVVPDTFKNDAEVVLKGQLHGDGFAVEPNGVMAKCPSKYNAADTADGRAARWPSSVRSRCSRRSWSPPTRSPRAWPARGADPARSSRAASAPSTPPRR